MKAPPKATPEDIQASLVEAKQNARKELAKQNLQRLKSKPKPDGDDHDAPTDTTERSVEEKKK